MILIHPKNRGCASVIITCHNYERYLDDCIDSVLSQEEQVEIIVVNDAPHNPDECRIIVSTYPNIKLIETGYENPLFARQAGLNASSNECIIFVDADDMLGEGYITNALDLIESNGVVYSDMHYFGAHNSKTDYAANIDPSTICMTNFLHVGCAVRKNLIIVSHAFNHRQVNTQYHEDWVFWRKVLSTGCKIAKQPSVYKTRIHDNNKSYVINKLPYYNIRGSIGDTISFCGFPGRFNLESDMIRYQTWPMSQIHEIIFSRNKTSVADSYTYISYNHKLEVLNYLARSAVTDYIFLYAANENYEDDICEYLLKSMDHTHGIVHHSDYDLLECTMIATMLLKNKQYASTADFRKENIRYV
jgi:glycosyltransferase involved in cell wall biosynthesis